MTKFKKQLKEYPTPISGLTLGMTGIASFWGLIINNHGLSNVLLIIICAIAISLLMPLIIKFILHPNDLLNDLKHPTVGSVVPTLAMTLMIISQMVNIFNNTLATSIWLISIAMHMVFLLTFTYFRFKSPNLNDLVPSWFVPPIGIVVACLTVPSVTFIPLAKIILLFGILSYAIMLPIMIYRICLKDKIEDARKPTLAILAAPGSLTLAGYLTLETNPNPLFTVFLFAIAILMTISVYLMLIKLLKLPFSPAYSAFTFPLAISATAMFKFGLWTQQEPLFSNYSNHFLTIAIIEGIASSIIISMIFIKYLKFLKNRNKYINKATEPKNPSSSSLSYQ